MRILHTSDWHLGAELYSKKRFDEFGAFLDWMKNTIVEQKIDTLIIAGDIYDVRMPPIEAQRLFYGFLVDISNKTKCRHVVAVAGNHDSGQVIDLPSELLKMFDVNVIGAARKNPEEEVILLKDDNNNPELIVCAVPFLREMDVITPGENTSILDREENYKKGIDEHFRLVSEYAHQLRANIQKDIPIIATGHLYTAGGKVLQDDHVRQIVGNIEGVESDVFTNRFDYVALGHLHVPQCVAKNDRIRYSGSPIPLGFDEVEQQKICCIVDFDGTEASVSELPIPEFKRLRTIRGDEAEIIQAIKNYKKCKEADYIRVIYTGENETPTLRDDVRTLLKNSPIECLAVENNAVRKKYIEAQSVKSVDLDMLTPNDVFERLLNVKNIPNESRKEYWDAYGEVLEAITLNSKEAFLNADDKDLEDDLDDILNDEGEVSP